VKVDRDAQEKREKDEEGSRKISFFLFRATDEDERGGGESVEGRSPRIKRTIA